MKIKPLNKFSRMPIVPLLCDCTEYQNMTCCNKNTENSCLSDLCYQLASEGFYYVMVKYHISQYYPPVVHWKDLSFYQTGNLVQVDLNGKQWHRYQQSPTRRLSLSVFGSRLDMSGLPSSSPIFEKSQQADEWQ